MNLPVSCSHYYISNRELDCEAAIVNSLFLWQ